MTSGTRRHSGLRRWATWAAGILVLLVGVRNGEGAPLPIKLLFGERDPHAVTETFISQHPEAALDIRQVAILSLGPAGTPEGDTGTEEGMDRVPYVFDRWLRIRLRLDASADQVGRLVLNDGTGHTVACLERRAGRTTGTGRRLAVWCPGRSHPGATGVLVRPGSYALEVHHARKGQANAPVQRVFVRSRLRSRFVASSASGAAREAPRPNAGAAVTLEASANCENCDFSNSILASEDFSGAALSGSTFIGAFMLQTNFSGAVMQGCLLTGPSPVGFTADTRVDQTTFSGADLTGAHFDGVKGDGANFTGAILDETTWGPQRVGTLLFTQDATYPAIMTNSTFNGAKVRNAIFNGALLDGSTFASATIVAGFQAFGVALSLPPFDLPFPNVSGGYLQTWCQRCRFDGATILGSTFDGVNLTSATFVDAVITSTTFNVDSIGRPADLSHAVLTGAHLDGVDLFGTKLTGVDLTVIAAGFVIHSDFSGDVTGANLSDVDFTGFDLSHANLSAAILSAQSVATLGGAKLSDGTAHGITLVGAAFPVGFGGFQGKDLRYANLTGATLTEANLGGANLANAILQGAVLTFANLDGANLFGAHLNKSATVAARLDGAFLRNVNLGFANLSGANLENANFYSSICVGGAGCECPPEGWSPTSPTCASAVGATMTATVFTGAYLGGVDMSSSTPQAAHFDQGAVLVGVNFTGAILSEDPNGNPTLFTGAFLQGVNFTDASVQGADFANAYVDVTSGNGATMTFLLDSNHTAFAGYWGTAAAPACVEVTYNGPTTLPPTDSSNICPDGVTGPCSETVWQSPHTPIGNAQPPSSVCSPGSCQCTLPGGGSVEPDFKWVIG